MSMRTSAIWSGSRPRAARLSATVAKVVASFLSVTLMARAPPILMASEI